MEHEYYAYMAVTNKLGDGIGSTLKLQESAQDYIITPTRDPLIITLPLQASNNDHLIFRSLLATL